ncbi:PA2169 family four-helix-bundle protein [Aquipseudomonas ullengensis]|uniref:PA2169 family four-helix-bundle protein n=1 Tax=Aquipseudomonas ullengensis TaxID=2759166 RepID=A0A7W4LJR1_9GAMM|nr:PA2169 family four-helix-bundle protein [Pseudomonas ullengensis]MBB2494383.1 PA2169 family four-helix-bundle protein [Pseudomonas ullengensis]
MSKSTAQLNELIEITRDGQRFYQHAEGEVKDVQLKSLFRDMAHAKTEIIQALASKVAANHEQVPQGGTVIGKLRQVYADTKASLSSDTDSTYVAQLEAAEDRLLHAFEDTLQDAEPDVSSLLRGEMPKIRACHDRMSALKHTMK